MKKIIVNVEFDGAYGASIDSLPGCIAVADTLGELRSMMDEAVQMHLALMRERKEPVPPEFKGGYELVYKMNTQGLLVAYDGVLTKAALSRITGINEKQLWHYSAGQKRPRLAQSRRIMQGLHKLGRELISVEL